MHLLGKEPLILHTHGIKTNLHHELVGRSCIWDSLLMAQQIKFLINWPFDLLPSEVFFASHSDALKTSWL